MTAGFFSVPTVAMLTWNDNLTVKLLCKTDKEQGMFLYI